MIKAIKIWKDTLGVFKKYPQLFFPFLFVALVDGFFLYLLYLFPQRPVSFILAPWIRRFFGEKFLHYPYNLYLLPQLYRYSHIFVGATLGMLMSAVASFMIKEAWENKRPNMLIGSLFSLRRYFSLFGIWLITFSLSFFILRMVRKIITNHYLFFLFSLFVVAVVASFFVYAIPAIIIERKSFFSSLGRSISFFKKFILVTLILNLVPSLLYFPVTILKSKIPSLLHFFSPEIIIGVLSLGVVVSLIVDIFTTASPVILFIKRR
ncbi:MAG: hypothetical protein B6D56_06370 [Candidatus Omnitrophica bacterium 4484_70.1]|nr:MAG: hypothetical protein B6D56_06370 [Candidatus Omnitrophica bacterium 4484_70.1]